MRKALPENLLELFGSLSPRRFVHEIDEGRVATRVDDEKATQNPRLVKNERSLRPEWVRERPAITSMGCEAVA